MPKKTIAKFSVFVIFLTGAFSCNNERKLPKFDETNSPYQPPRVVGKIESDEIKESSGLAASLCQENVLWTHNDSGDGPYVYAIDTTGKTLGVWKVANAKNEDWEDIDAYKAPTGDCYLYIAETGNTDKLERDRQTIYRVKEPTIGSAVSLSKKDAPSTEPSEKIDYRYPDGNKDAETMLVRPENGDIYVLTKMRSSPSGVYRIAANFGSNEVSTAIKVVDLSVPAVPNGFLTGGAVSPDGKRVILCDYAAAYELTLPDGSANFDEIWKDTAVPVSLGSRKQGEAITYSADGTMLFATSEGKDAPVIEVDRKK